jgi:hypothetical protein
MFLLLRTDITTATLDTLQPWSASHVARLHQGM